MMSISGMKYAMASSQISFQTFRTCGVHLAKKERMSEAEVIRPTCRRLTALTKSSIDGRLPISRFSGSATLPHLQRGDFFEQDQCS